MKKFISIFLILISCFVVFAETVPIVTYDSLDFTFQPTMARYDAMGQSGLASPTKTDSFYTNPANLAIKRGFAIVVPSISLTVVFYKIALKIKEILFLNPTKLIITANEIKT